MLTQQGPAAKAQPAPNMASAPSSSKNDLSRADQLAQGLYANRWLRCARCNKCAWLRCLWTDIDGIGVLCFPCDDRDEEGQPAKKLAKLDADAQEDGHLAQGFEKNWAVSYGQNPQEGEKDLS